MKRELRPHQTRAIELLRQSLGSGKRRPVLQAPTGFGKTLLAAAVVEGALAKQKRVIFTVPALSLVDQTVKAFWDEGIRDVGVIQGTNAMTDWSRPVQVASVQTLQRRPIPEADVVMIDECHRWFDFYGTVDDRSGMAKPAIHRAVCDALDARPRAILRRLNYRGDDAGFDLGRLSIAISCVRAVAPGFDRSSYRGRRLPRRRSVRRDERRAARRRRRGYLAAAS